MEKEISNRLRAALDDTLELLSGFTEKELNTVPYEGSWTAAQVCRHLEKSEMGVDKLLQAPMETADRQPDEKDEWLRDTFLNFEIKFKSPDFILPEEKHYTKNELELSLKDIRDKMLAAVETARLDQMAPLPEGNPLQGFTKMETVLFITYHTTRHNHQLRKIRDAIK